MGDERYIKDAGILEADLVLQIKKRVKEDFGLSCSIGIALNKLLAKLDHKAEELA